MLKKLLRKELALSMHPTVPLMLALCVMVLIPNYPYTVIFFYSTLSLFFTCLSGRENNDVAYTVGLPVQKCDAVRARMLFAVIFQLAQLALTAVMCFVRRAIGMPANAGGLEANIALIGAGLMLFGMFNLTFFTAYYRNVKRVGGSFVTATVLFFAAILVGEVLVNAVPFVRDRLDTADPLFLPEKLTVLALGAAVYAAATFAAYRKSVRLFEMQDL